jgi:hypothetical protein
MKKKIAIILLLTLGFFTFTKTNSNKTVEKPPVKKEEEKIEETQVVTEKKEVPPEPLALEKNQGALVILKKTEDGIQTESTTPLKNDGFRIARGIDGERGIYIRVLQDKEQILETVETDPNDFPLHNYEKDGTIHSEPPTAQPIPFKLPNLPSGAIVEIFKIRKKLDPERKHILLLKRYKIEAKTP